MNHVSSRSVATSPGRVHASCSIYRARACVHVEALVQGWRARRSARLLVRHMSNDGAPADELREIQDGLAAASKSVARVGAAAGRVATSGVRLGLASTGRSAKRLAKATLPALRRVKSSGAAWGQRGLRALDGALQHAGFWVSDAVRRGAIACGTYVGRLVLLFVARVDLLSLGLGIFTTLLLPRRRRVDARDTGRRRRGRDESGPGPEVPPSPTATQAGGVTDTVPCEGDSPLVLDALRAQLAVAARSGSSPLLNLSYLRGFLAAGGLGPLLHAVNAWAADAPGQEAALLASTLRLVAPGLRGLSAAQAADALPTQLHARLDSLGTHLPSGLAALQKQCKGYVSQHPRFRLLRPTLDAPGTSPLELALPTGSSDAITALAALEGGLIAAGGRDGRLRICSPLAVRVVATGVGHGPGSVITCIVALHDGCLLATGATDGTVRVWTLPSVHALTQRAASDVSSLTCSRVMAAGRVAALAALPGGGGGRLAVAGDSSDVIIMEALHGTLEQRLPGHNTRVMALCVLQPWTPDSEAHEATAPPCTLVSAAADGELRVWHGVHGPRCRVTCVARITPQVIGGGGSASLNPRTNAILQLLPLANGCVAAASMEAVRVWSITAAVEAWDGIDVDDPPPELKLPSLSPLAALPSGKVNAVASLTDGRVVLGGDASLRTYALHGGISTVTRTLRGRRCATASLLGLSDGRLVAGGVDGTLRVWSGSQAGQNKQQSQHTDRVSCLAALPGGRCASGSWDGTLRLWSASGECAKECSGHNARIVALVCVTSGDETILASAAPGALRFWRATDGVCLRCADAPHGRAGLQCLTALSEGGKVASGGDDGNIKVWDLAAGGDCVLTLSPAQLGVASPPRVTCIAAFPAGDPATSTWLAAGDSDGYCRIWCAASGACVATAGRPHAEGGVSALVVLPDGLHLVTAGEDKGLCALCRAAGGAWTAIATWRGAATALDVARCLLPASRGAVLAVGTRSTWVWNLHSQACDIINVDASAAVAPAGGSGNQPGQQAACAVTHPSAVFADTQGAFAFAAGPFLRLGGLPGTSSMAPCYLDDAVRCLVALAPGREQHGQVVAVGTDGGSVHFVETTWP